MDSQIDEAVLMRHWEDDSLDELLNLLVTATNIRILLRRTLINFHGLDTGVVFGRKLLQNKVRVLINSDEISRFQFGRINETDDRKEICSTGGRLDYGTFGLMGVEINIGP